MRVIIEVRSGIAAGKKTWLQPGQRIIVGRTEGADWVLSQDGQISSRHFALECDYYDCWIRDLGSSNGTVVNGKRVKESRLENGDSILAGQTTLFVQIEAIPGPRPQGRAVSAFAPPPLPSPPESNRHLTEVFGTKQVARERKTTPSDSIPKPFDNGLQDQSPDVRREALLAAAWTRQPWVIEYCRSQARTPSPEQWEALRLLAILGQPADLHLLRSIGNLSELGPFRFQLLATFGHPKLVEMLLERISGADAEEALHAGLAFTKITGIQFNAEAPTPQALEVAQKEWCSQREKFALGTRWRRGLNMSERSATELLEQLDLESRWETCLRGKFEGTWNGTSRDLAAFPQRIRFPQ